LDHIPFKAVYMDIYKLKTKIGEYEFEAEGPVDIVVAQFDEFKELIKTISTAPTQKLQGPPETDDTSDAFSHLPLEKVLKVEGRVVSLTAKCETIDEAMLLILLGQKELRKNQEVTGSEIMDGLQLSGYKLDRVDRILDRLSANGSVITMGIHRGRRYRLSNVGLSTALGIAKEVIETVP
jgi:hypothetical protein